MRVLCQTLAGGDDGGNGLCSMRPAVDAYSAPCVLCNTQQKRQQIPWSCTFIGMLKALSCLTTGFLVYFFLNNKLKLFSAALKLSWHATLTVPPFSKKVFSTAKLAISYGPPHSP
jgi:hypothetical protein